MNEMNLHSADDALQATAGTSNPENYLLKEISLWPDGGKGPLSRFNSPFADSMSHGLESQCDRIWE